MQINSVAGEFDFDITGIEAERSDIVLVGKMGVWEARTVVTEADLIRLIQLSFRSSVFWKVLPRLPRLMLAGLRSRSSHVNQNPEDSI